MSNVKPFPNWKPGATPTERFSELETESRERPERFRKVVVIYIEELPGHRTKARWLSSNCTTTEVLGVIDMGRSAVYEDTRG